MKPGEETLGEASQMLCNILKNSRQDGADDQVRDNNNTLKTLDTTLPNLSPLNTLRAASDLENRDDMKASSPEQSLSSKAAPVEDNVIQSVHGNSGDESDVDTSCGQTEDKDEAQKENDREQDEYCSTNSASPSDSKEAKRARVENILTSIRQCPQTGYDSLTPVTFSDMKRQKRKQPQPQQHEVKTPLAPKAKYRKLERLVLHKHILQLQRQLQAVKKTFNEISRCSSDDSEEDKDASFLHEDLENEESSQGSVIIAAHDNDGVEPTAQRSSAGGRHVEETEHHSPLSLCLNGKVTTREGSENTKYVSKPADSYTHQNGHLSVPVYQPTLSSQFVSLTLKSEIIQAVKRAVDSAVITVLEKHVGSFNNHQQMNHRGSEPDFQPEREQRFLPSKTSKKEDDMQQPLTIPKPRLEREALKEAISNSQTERPAELIIPFHDHLRLLERLGHPRQQLPEKQSLFDPLLPRSESSDLIKPHINPALPFPPFPPYSGYMHAGLLPPLFPAPEPEQTEALPLVVSSATKKKRTKVTDTRLTTKGKCTPPQDSDQVPATVEENGEERLHPLSSPFPHPYLPPVLPTSVAITNPSLHQSELFGAFRFQENSFEAAVASSPGPEQDLAKSPQQDSGQGVDSVKSEGGVDSPAAPASPVDGQSTNKTSILTPMHLRKAKLMFFYTRYPNSGVLKTYFPDVAFNKNNTAQLVKWFSNFREFYYIQMEKFARQAATDGHSQAEDLTVPRDSDLFRQLNNHYNRNNHIEAPESFRLVSETTLKEFFTAISSKRDVDSSWKKAIYKVIARLDEPMPEFLKSPSWMQHLGEA